MFLTQSGARANLAAPINYGPEGQKVGFMLDASMYENIRDRKSQKTPARLTKVGLYIEFAGRDIFQRANNLPLNKVLEHLGQGICFGEIES